jgi:hypothetical protein
LLLMKLGCNRGKVIGEIRSESLSITASKNKDYVDLNRLDPTIILDFYWLFHGFVFKLRPFLWNTQWFNSANSSVNRVTINSLIFQIISSISIGRHFPEFATWPSQADSNFYVHSRFLTRLSNWNRWRRSHSQCIGSSHLDRSIWRLRCLQTSLRAVPQCAWIGDVFSPEIVERIWKDIEKILKVMFNHICDISTVMFHHIRDISHLMSIRFTSFRVGYSIALRIFPGQCSVTLRTFLMSHWIIIGKFSASCSIRFKKCWTGSRRPIKTNWNERDLANYGQWRPN